MQAIMFVVGLVLWASVPLLLMSHDTITEVKWNKRYLCKIHGWAVYTCREKYEAYPPGESPETANPGIISTRISQLCEWIEAIETADRRSLP